MATTRLELEGGTSRLLETLRSVEAEIPWSAAVVQAIDLINTIYTLYNGVEEVSRAVYDMMQKVKDFEIFLCMDVLRHVSLTNGRRPYHLTRVVGLLERSLDAVQTLEVVDGGSPGPWPDRYWRHLAAEIQTTLAEHGFCRSMGAIYDQDEAGKKLDSVWIGLGRVSELLRRDCAGVDVSASMIGLHGSAADFNGIREAMTVEDARRIGARLQQTRAEIIRLLDEFCAMYLHSGSELVVRYLAAQSILRREFVRRLGAGDRSQTVVAEHAIHPGTRGWFLERFARWLADDRKRLIVLSGDRGTGKTALASAVCKLYGQNQVACHFFDDGRRSGAPVNRLADLIRNVAYGLCHSLPEYLNHLDDELGKSESGLPDLLSGRSGWRPSYETLLKRPLRALYGKDRSKGADRRPLVVIDGLDECLQDDWKDVQDFLRAFISDLSTSFCLFVTVWSRHLAALIPPLSPADQDLAEGVRLDDRAWINWHIKDIEIYLSTSLGAILSGEDEGDVPEHARADAMTLQNAIDELLKTSSGRFDFAIELMETFAAEMSKSGQFLGSLKKALIPIRNQHGDLFEQKVADFASPYRAYRDKEGRSVDVRVIRQSQYLMDKTRVALIRGRHKLNEINQNGN